MTITRLHVITTCNATYALVKPWNASVDPANEFPSRLAAPRNCCADEFRDPRAGTRYPTTELCRAVYS